MIDFNEIKGKYKLKIFFQEYTFIKILRITYGMNKNVYFKIGKQGVSYIPNISNYSIYEEKEDNKSFNFQIHYTETEQLQEELLFCTDGNILETQDWDEGDYISKSAGCWNISDDGLFTIKYSEFDNGFYVVNDVFNLKLL